LLHRKDYTNLLRYIYRIGIPPAFQHNRSYEWLITPESGNQNEALDEMLVHYNAFQNTPPNNQFRDISVQSMMRDFIFNPLQQAAPVAQNQQQQPQQGGYKRHTTYKRKKQHKTSKSRNRRHRRSHRST
jgi:hypothetical protein